MGVNKVELSNGDVLVDMTGVTVTEDTLGAGETALDAKGNPIVGKAVFGGGQSEKKIAYVDCILDFATLSVVSIDKTYDEIIAMVEAENYVVLRGKYASVASPINTMLMPLSVYIKEQNILMFTGMIQSTVAGQAVILSLTMLILANNNIITNVRVVSTTDLT